MPSRLARRIAIPLLLLGLLLLLSTAASAANIRGDAIPFGARDLITGLMGLLLLAIGAYIKLVQSALERRIDDIEDASDKREAALDRRLDAGGKRMDDLHKQGEELHRILLRDHLTKEDVIGRFERLDASIEAVHRRLDLQGMPRAERA